jgi:PAS domain S-box-containing protein
MATREASGAALPKDAVPAALDAVPFGVVVLDEHQRVAYGNRTAHRLLPNGLRIGEDAQWATVPRPPPERGTTDWGGGPDRADSPQIAITTLSGRLGGRVRAMRVAADGLGPATLIVMSPRSDSAERGRDPGQRLREVEAVSRVGSWTWEVGSGIVRWSNELFRLNGLLPGSVPVTFERVAALFHPEDRGAVLELIEHCRRSGQPFESTHRVLRPDGTVRWQRARGRAVTLGGRTVRIHATVQDITRRVERERALHRSLEESRRLASENEALRHEVEAQLKEVRESRARIVQAADEARRGLERDLHDGAQQRLTTLGLILRSAQAQLGTDADAMPAVAQALRDALTELQAGLGELRALARGLHPAILTDEGLVPALETLSARSPLPMRLSADPLGRLPLPIEATAYFVAAEALGNAVRHAAASSAHVSVEHRDGMLTITVSDDGAGGARIQDGSGLRVVSDRVATLDGRLEVDSPAGAGTRVRAELPCA